MSEYKRPSWTGMIFVCLCMTALIGMMLIKPKVSTFDSSAIQKGDECRVGQGEWFPSVDGTCYAFCENGSWKAECWKTQKTAPKRDDGRMLISDYQPDYGYYGPRPDDPIAVSGQPVISITTGMSYMIISKESLDTMLKEHPEARLNVVIYEEDEHGDMVRAREPECLAKMEAAMKVMEPYLAKHKSDMAQKESDEYFLAKIGALLQWGATKADCWRQP